MTQEEAFEWQNEIIISGQEQKLQEAGYRGTLMGYNLEMGRLIQVITKDGYSPKIPLAEIVGQFEDANGYYRHQSTDLEDARQWREAKVKELLSVGNE